MQENITEPIVITEPLKSLRGFGRLALSGKWRVAVITAAIYTLCIQLPPTIFDALFAFNTVVPYSNDYGYDSYSIYTNHSWFNNLSSGSPISGVYILLVTGALALGLTLFFLALFRGQSVKETDIFLGFKKFGKALGLMLFQSLFIILWSLLLIFPGIIASIRYSQAFFIMADNPHKGIRQCMDESKMMMGENKATYFCLNLSFVGWILLSLLPVAVLSAVGEFMNAGDLIIGLLACIGVIFMAPVTAYMYATSTAFYEIVSGHFLKGEDADFGEAEAIAGEDSQNTDDFDENHPRDERI